MAHPHQDFLGVTPGGEAELPVHRYSKQVCCNIEVLKHSHEAARKAFYVLFYYACPFGIKEMANGRSRTLSEGQVFSPVLSAFERAFHILRVLNL